MDFEYWKQSVENVVFLLKFKYYLPDENYRINYDNGLHICDMAKIIIKRI